MLVYRDGIVVQEPDRKPDEHEVALYYLAKPSEQQVREVLEGMFQCHPLVIDDCIGKRQRPKVDEYPDHAFIPFYVLEDKWRLAEISLVIGRNFLVLISERNLHFVEQLEQDLLLSPERMQHVGLLLYEILDTCAEQYLEFVDTVEEKVAELETRIYQDPFADVGKQIFQLKRILHRFRRVFSEERNAVGTLMHAHFPYTSDEASTYLMDVYDHLNQAADALDGYRDALTGLLELQMSMKSDRMNEIMKTLTVVSTFFMPISFIVGLYGVNVKVPEYGWKYGYAWVWLWILVSVVGMWVYFKRKKWF